MDTDHGFPTGFLEAYSPDTDNGWCVLMDLGSNSMPISVGFVTLGSNRHTGIPFVFEKKKISSYFCASLNSFSHGTNVSFVVSTYLDALERPTGYLPNFLRVTIESYYLRKIRRHWGTGNNLDDSNLLVLDWGKSKWYDGGLSHDILAFGLCSVGLESNFATPLLFRYRLSANDLRWTVNNLAYLSLPISDRKWGLPRGRWKVVRPTNQLLFG